jgi:hypothetical protein
MTTKRSPKVSTASDDLDFLLALASEQPLKKKVSENLMSDLLAIVYLHYFL